MPKSITVDLDEATYQRLITVAEEGGADLQDALKTAIDAYLEQKQAYRADPFFQIGEGGASALGDLAAKHDYYLYEDNQT